MSLLFCVAGCAADEAAIELTEPPCAFEVFNRTQWPLEEVTVTPRAGVPFALTNAPLPPDERSLRCLNGGEFLLTVVRRKVRGGSRLAFTTGRELSCPRGARLTLEVLEGEFRLTTTPPNPPPSPPIMSDQGARDGALRERGVDRGPHSTFDHGGMDWDRSDGALLDAATGEQALPDARAPDSGVRDAHIPDAYNADTDGMLLERGLTDGGLTDGRTTDGEPTDGGPTNGGNTDGGPIDGGNTDDGPTDGGNAERGLADASAPDARVIPMKDQGPVETAVLGCVAPDYVYPEYRAHPCTCND